MENMAAKSFRSKVCVRDGLQLLTEVPPCAGAAVLDSKAEY